MKLLALVSLTVLFGLPMAVRSAQAPHSHRTRVWKWSHASFDHQTQPESEFAFAILMDNSGSLRSQFDLVNSV